MEPVNFSIHSRSRGLLLDGPADLSTSTPIASHCVLPTTPEKMEENILARIAVATTAAARSRSPTNFFDASQSIEEGSTNNGTFNRQIPKEVPILFYRNTTTVSCHMLKANKLSENGNDNFKRKEMILKVLQTEDLLTMINNMRPPPTCSEENPTGYSPQRMIHDELGKHAVSADDQFLYAHDYARLYEVISIATSESLQFLFLEATTSGNGIMLWESIISKLFGMTDRDAFDAAEKLVQIYTCPDSGGLYLSRFQNDTSHIVLKIALEAITHYQSIYLTVILLDFMAYTSHNISKIIHRLHQSVGDARHKFEKRMVKAANEYNLQFKYIKIFEAIIADVFIMPYINHHDDTILTYLATSDIIDTIGCRI